MGKYNVEVQVDYLLGNNLFGTTSYEQLESVKEMDERYA